MINGDKIRAMSDYQLTEFFETILKRLNDAKDSVHVRSSNCCDVSAAQGKVYAYDDSIGIVAEAIEIFSRE